jgi:hypothetical protein
MFLLLFSEILYWFSKSERGGLDYILLGDQHRGPRLPREFIPKRPSFLPLSPYSGAKKGNNLGQCLQLTALPPSFSLKKAVLPGGCGWPWDSLAAVRLRPSCLLWPTGGWASLEALFSPWALLLILLGSEEEEHRVLPAHSQFPSYPCQVLTMSPAFPPWRTFHLPPKAPSSDQKLSLQEHFPVLPSPQGRKGPKEAAPCWCLLNPISLFILPLK